MTPQKIEEGIEKIFEEFERKKKRELLLCRLGEEDFEELKSKVLEKFKDIRKEIARAIFKDIYEWCCMTVPGSDKNGITICYLIKENAFNKLKQKWCKNEGSRDR